MNNILSTGISFWEMIGGIFAIAISIIAVKIAISFDVNKYLERKDRKLAQRIKNTCPHIYMELLGDDGGKPTYNFQSFFEKPYGALQWQCQCCGTVKNHNNDYGKLAEYYAEKPDEYVKKNIKFKKLLKKSGQA